MAELRLVDLAETGSPSGHCSSAIPPTLDDCHRRELLHRRSMFYMKCLAAMGLANTLALITSGLRLDWFEQPESTRKVLLVLECLLVIAVVVLALADWCLLLRPHRSVKKP